MLRSISIVVRLKSLFWTMVETDGIDVDWKILSIDSRQIILCSFFICEGSLLDSIKKLNKVIKWTQGHFGKTYSAR
jgi:hypothetical protein